MRGLGREADAATLHQGPHPLLAGGEQLEPAPVELAVEEGDEIERPRGEDLVGPVPLGPVTARPPTPAKVLTLLPGLAVLGRPPIPHIGGSE